jgi:cell division protein FtsN
LWLWITIPSVVVVLTIIGICCSKISKKKAAAQITPSHYTENGLVNQPAKTVETELSINESKSEVPAKGK